MRFPQSVCLVMFVYIARKEKSDPDWIEKFENKNQAKATIIASDNKF